MSDSDAVRRIGGSTIAAQVQWLFNVKVEHKGFSVREELETEQDRMHFASAFILEQLGIEPDNPAAAENYRETMLVRFGGQLPTTNLFSTYARETVPEIDPVRIRTLRCSDGWSARRFYSEQWKSIFSAIGSRRASLTMLTAFSHSRWPSRIGAKAGQVTPSENHLQVIFNVHKLRYQRGVATEGKAKPDFLFPGSEEYKNASYNAELLTMLGAKTTCKDRWRQVLAEAKRINHKHLLTLEAAISSQQTDQMQEHNLQLVIPRGLHETLTRAQQRTLLTLAEFTTLVKQREQAGAA